MIFHILLLMVVIRVVCTVDRKSKPQIFACVFAKCFPIFNIFFTSTFCGIFVIKWLKFGKSVNILRRYGQKLVAYFFGSP